MKIISVDFQRARAFESRRSRSVAAIASISGAGGRSSSSVGTRVARDRARAHQRRRRRQRREQIDRLARAEQLDRDDMSRERRARASALSAAAMLMLTWSSLLPDVGIVSTLAGCASVLSSDVSAAAVTCAIISPTAGRRDASGTPAGRSSDGLTSRSERRSLIVASCASAMAQDVGGERDRRAMEVAARDDLAGVGEDHRVVGGGIGLDVERRDARRRARRAPRRAPAARSASSRRPARGRSSRARR